MNPETGYEIKTRDLEEDKITTGSLIKTARDTKLGYMNKDKKKQIIIHVRKGNKQSG